MPQDRKSGTHGQIPERDSAQAEHGPTDCGTIDVLTIGNPPIDVARRQLFGWSLGFALLALALGSLFVYPRQWTRGFLINDEAWYAEPARSLAQGHGFVTETLYPVFARSVTSLPMGEPFKQIGYPFVAALAARVTGTLSDQLFVAIAVVGFSLVGMATWLVAQAMVKNRRMAAVITLATIGNPSFWSYWTAGLPESLFTALFLGGIYFALVESTAACAGAGVLLATAVYFKGFAVLYVPVVATFLAFSSTEGRARRLSAFAGAVVVTFALATVALPSGTRQLADASGDYAGSMLLWETRGAYPAVEGPLYDISPVHPFAYIAKHPLDFAEKFARMVSRTKDVMGELGGPAFGGVLFPLLLFVGVAGAQDIGGIRRRGQAGPTDGADALESRRLRLMVAGLLIVNFGFFWATNFKARYFAHLFPLMLAAAVLELRRVVPQSSDWLRNTPRLIVFLAVGYFLVYPPTVGLWSAYRDPNAYLGRMLAVRWADYRRVASNVRAHVPEHGMVMSDMAHEISWYTGHPTVFFPGSENQVEYLLDKFDVKAVYEHPRVLHDWAVLRDRFTLVDDRDGRLWVRRN
jgi:hypothetical protein